MGTGAITSYVDVAQLVLYAFWIFFFGLIYYLQQESKREGFPLESPSPDGSVHYTPGFVGMPTPKTFLLHDGTTVTAPNDKVSPQVLKAAPRHGWIGAPLEPTGTTPMLDGIGPGAWADRADVPDMTHENTPKIVPLRVAKTLNVAAQDADPRGMTVKGDDGEVGGTVVDLWVDQSEMMFRYIEVKVLGGARTVLLPVNFARIKRDGITVHSIMGHQLAYVPGTKHPDQVTFLEEEKIMAYYGAGMLYADPQRQEPLV